MPLSPLGIVRSSHARADTRIIVAYGTAGGLAYHGQSQRRAASIDLFGQGSGTLGDLFGLLRADPTIERARLLVPSYEMPVPCVSDSSPREMSGMVGSGSAVGTAQVLANDCPDDDDGVCELTMGYSLIPHHAAAPAPDEPTA